MQPDRIIIFDAQCGLCQNAVRFVVARDRNRSFRFAAAQSRAGIDLQSSFSVDSIAEGSLFLIEGKRLYRRSDAVLKICSMLGGVYRLVPAAAILPRGVRDRMYDIVAEHRRKWFGFRDDFADFVRAHADRFME